MIIKNLSRDVNLPVSDEDLKLGCGVDWSIFEIPFSPYDNLLSPVI